MSTKSRKYSRFIFIMMIVLLAIGLSCENSKNHFQFIFMTDIHVQPELRADEGFETAIRKVNQMKPDFVITGGDLIMDALGQPEARARKLYQLYQTMLRKFKVPVYNTLGNHEVFGLYESSGINPTHPEYGKEMYQKYLQTEKYYSFDHKGWHFIILDAIGYKNRKYIGKVESVQLDWLKQDLEKVDQKTPIVVSLHIPLVSVANQMSKGGTAALSEGLVVTNSLEVLRAFENHNLKLVLQGHLHIVEEIIYQDVHFITGGAVSGAWWKGPNRDFDEGFVVVEIHDDEFQWHYETFGWKAGEKEHK